MSKLAAADKRVIVRASETTTGPGRDCDITN